ncbi:hypothetical protein [Streptomyces sp. NPDC060031]|uniref:hypothetical protein n=1 Tax=Streptomyces sp. NPDC060031 TaxID=3347043 RepID=UPI0036CD01CA
MAAYEGSTKKGNRYSVRLMGVGSSGVPYIVDLDPAGIGTVVAVNVSGDAAYSYGTALGPVASRLFAQSEHP